MYPVLSTLGSKTRKDRRRHRSPIPSPPHARRRVAAPPAFVCPSGIPLPKARQVSSQSSEIPQHERRMTGFTRLNRLHIEETNAQFLDQLLVAHHDLTPKRTRNAFPDSGIP